MTRGRKSNTRRLRTSSLLIFHLQHVKVFLLAFLTLLSDHNQTYFQHKKQQNWPKVLIEKSTHFAISVILVVIVYKMQCKIELVGRTQCNGPKGQVFYNSSTQSFSWFGGFCTNHKCHKHERQNATTNSAADTPLTRAIDLVSSSVKLEQLLKALKSAILPVQISTS